MRTVPLELPVRASEAGALAGLLFEHFRERPLNVETRNRFASRASSVEFSSFELLPYSLERDPIHPSTYYVAADARGADGQQTPLLLRIALASSPSSGLFPNAVLIGRMRTASGREVVINAIPFASTDRVSIRTFAFKVNSAFLPRPQGSLPAIAAGARHAEITLPAAFAAFRSVLKNKGVNMASIAGEAATTRTHENRDGENPLAPGYTGVPIAHFYDAALWAAVRGGWREGYTADAGRIVISGNTCGEIDRSVDGAIEAVRDAGPYTKFSIDASSAFEVRADTRQPHPWTDPEVNERFEQIFSDVEDRAWLTSEFSRFEPAVLRRLAVKFGRGLLINERLFDAIRKLKAGQKPWRQFDFEVSLGPAGTITTAEELSFCLQFFKARGRSAQLIAPNLGLRNGFRDSEGLGSSTLDQLSECIAGMAEVARAFNATIAIDSAMPQRPAVLERIAAAISGRVSYGISGELQLQLFDLLREQPQDSYWRKLYGRMAAQANEFAARGAFGPESALAGAFGGDSLGDPYDGRAAGNRFLILWLGNVAGSRDLHCPDGDHRFFKEKLDELPAGLAQEVQARNTRYIVWPAEHLKP